MSEQDDKLLASRCMDGTLKLWDLRKFKQPLAAWDDLPTNYPTTNTIFSPDECLLLTGAFGLNSCVALARWIIQGCLPLHRLDAILLADADVCLGGLCQSLQHGAV
jgi:WD40 repeat protein